jgi:hypothetical protein
VPPRNGKGRFLGLLAGVFMSAGGRSAAGSALKDMEEMEFKTSTRRMGVRFTESIRNAFRSRWIRKKSCQQ